MEKTFTPVLWGRASSVNVQKVMWALAECEVSHERRDAGGKYGQTDTPDFAAMNPMRRVPVWQEDELTLWESQAILRHLSRGPCASLWPTAPRAQALADQWMEFTTTTLSPPLITVFFQTYRLPVEQRSPKVLADALRDLESALDVLETALGSRSWLAGDDFSLGDIPAGSLMYRYHTLEIPRPDRPDLANWYSRLTERPAYRATVMTSYEELRGA